MSWPRTLASSLLRVALRHTSSESQDWARAMLRELDFIESDWAALLWALGSTTAVLQHSGRRFWRHFSGKPVRIVWRLAIAGVLVLCVLGLPLLSFHFFPLTVDARTPWLAWLIVIGLPMTIFIVAALALWRTRRPLAVGILLSATALGAHFAIAVQTHRNYQ